MKIFANQVSFRYSKEKNSFDRCVNVEVDITIAGEFIPGSDDLVMTARQWEAFKAKLEKDFDGVEVGGEEVEIKITESWEYIGWRDRMLVAGKTLDV